MHRGGGADDEAADHLDFCLMATRSRQVAPFLLTVCAASASTPTSCATVAIDLVADSDRDWMDTCHGPWQPELVRFLGKAETPLFVSCLPHPKSCVVELAEEKSTTEETR